jgi:hypothetical protein
MDIRSPPERDHLGIVRDSMISRREFWEHRKNRITIWGLWKFFVWRLHRMKKIILFRCG